MIRSLDKDKIESLLSDGYSQKQIAENFGCSQAYISKSIKKFKIKNPNRKLKNAIKNKYIGQKFGSWQIIELSNTNKRTYYNCECTICGNTKRVLLQNLKDGRSTKCQLCRLNQMNKGYMGLCGSYVCIVKHSAKARNINFDLDNKYIWSVFEQQNGKCALSGLDIKISNDPKIKTASLDRIDSNLGYVVGNIQWVHKHVNNMKQHYSQEYFIKICKLVSKNNKCQN